MIFALIAGITSFITTLFLQVSLGASWVDILLWPLQQTTAFLFTFAAILSFTFLISALCNSLRWTLILAQGFFFCVGIVCLLKRQSLGMPLSPWDIETVKETFDTVLVIAKKSVYITLTWTFIVSFIALSIYRWLPRYRVYFHLKKRLISGFVSMLAFFVLILANNPLHDYLFRQKFTLPTHTSNTSFAQNGLLVNFILLAEKGQLYPPNDYSLQSAQDLVQQYTKPRRKPASTSDLRPDVVVVMSESLFDPTELKGVRWKQDPLAYTRSLAGNRPLSLSVVPTYGGKTANSEFEFLTGHAIKFLSKGTVPYESLIQSPQISMVDTFNHLGYHTVAIHPGYRDFWNREEVYEKFGFQDFYDIKDFKEQQIYGQYISDESILKVLQNSLNDNQDPSFHFIVTMQNHMPYNQSPFELKNLLFETEGLQLSEQVILNYYTQLVKATDDFHHDLVKMLEARQRPTLLVIFGDHLPSLMKNYGLFLERMVHSENQEDWTPEEWQRMYKTPLVLWSNFGFQNETSPIEVALLGARILAKLNINTNPYQNFLAQMSDKVRIVNPNIKTNPDDRPWVDQYRIFQYGILSGDILQPDGELQVKNEKSNDAASDKVVN